MFVENERVSSRITARLFALWDGDTVQLSTVMSWSGQAFPQMKSVSVLSGLTLRGGADIHAQISSQIRVSPRCQKGERREIVECHQHSSDRRVHVRL
ncbi:hypothetical protein UPYG_G00156100 [Umbra pygmaea]|uniref:Uncharacterized protein n=1 Tax=Umbra pygmaea TaxID=75934 RepID=A0ABD0WY80_UMBPY